MPYYQYTVNLVIGGKDDADACRRLDDFLADDRIYAVEWIDGGTEYQESKED